MTASNTLSVMVWTSPEESEVGVIKFGSDEVTIEFSGTDDTVEIVAPSKK